MVQVAGSPHFLEAVDGVDLLAEPLDMHEEVRVVHTHQIGKLARLRVLLNEAEDGFTIILGNIFCVILQASIITISLNALRLSALLLRAA